MNEIEFNLIDEPWIRVMDSNCNVSEVSLKDAILNAHNYKSLSGELPTQDIAVMRLMLAVLHTVYSRADENGNESPLDIQYIQGQTKTETNLRLRMTRTKQLTVGKLYGKKDAFPKKQ